MKRKLLLDLLEIYSGDKGTLKQLKEFVKSQENCFERTNLSGHITASCWLVSKDGQRVLLTHHKKLDKWLQPGGHCDGDHDVLRAALKEAREESGIYDWEIVSGEVFDIDIHLIPARKNEPEHFHYDVRFLLRAKEDEQYTVSDESHDLAWVDIEKLEEYTSEESMHRMNSKWRQLLTANLS